jgi:hypothetical protein
LEEHRKGGQALSDRGVKCTQNLDDVLLSAKASSSLRNEDLVTEVDLLHAFVRRGGGQLGKWLRARGMILEALTTTLFLEDGELDWSRFEAGAQGILHGCIDCARQKGHESLSRIHFLYGLLRQPKGPLHQRLLDQGIADEQLADVLFVSMESGTAVSGFVQGRAAEMSPGLLKTLCAAEVDASSSGDATLVSEHHLLTALLKDGGGEAGKFLVAKGVRLGELMR